MSKKRIYYYADNQPNVFYNVQTVDELAPIIISEKYSITDELKIHREKDIKPEQFRIMNEYIEASIEKATHAFDNDSKYELAPDPTEV